MKPDIRLICDPDDTPQSTRRLHRLHDPQRGVVALRATPGRGGEGIVRDVLAALGKRFADRRGPRQPAKLNPLAAIWLRAEQVRDLVLPAA